MKKNSGSVRINTTQEHEIKELCQKLGVSRSELFRKIILWGISLNITIPRQNRPYKFEDSASTSGKTSYLFGAKMADELLIKIDQLCLENGVSQSHLFRFFIDKYLELETGKQLAEKTDLKEVNRTLHIPIIPVIPIKKQIVPNNHVKLDITTRIKDIQTSYIEGMQFAHVFGNFVGLITILYGSSSNARISKNDLI